MPDICVVHLVRKKNGIEPFHNFIKSYLENSAGVDHELLILYKGFTGKTDILPYENVLSDVPHSLLEIADRGFDLRSYFVAAEACRNKYCCFINSFSVILDKDWLLKLYKNISQPGVGLVGVTGSWGSMGHGLIIKTRAKSYMSKLKRALFKYPKKILVSIYFLPFPNHHIRTNGFMIRCSTMQKIRRGMLLTKIQTYMLESGRHGITRQVEEMGLKSLIVGRGGRGYEKDEWGISNTFWHGEQENLLISDNQTRKYDSGDLKWKQKWERFAWGKINTCSYCHTASLLYFCSKDYNRRATQETFDHYRCPKCKLIFIAPIPDNLSKYYPDKYHAIPKTIEDLDASSKSENYKIEIIKRFCEKGKLLEIGPSYGSFTYLAKKNGYETEAIEMDKRCCQFSNEVIGVNTINSNKPIEILQYKKSYDVIAFWHLIEHLPNPWPTLDAVYASLKPGGILVLSTPNPDSFQFKVTGRYWHHLDAPRHVMLIPMALLAEKLKSLGMQVKLITTKDQGSMNLNSIGWKRTFRNLTSQSYTKKILNLIGLLLGLLFSPIEKIEGKGSAYTMVFMKPY